MATDWVTLFDLDLSKAIVRLDASHLERFLAERGPGLAERDQRLARERNAELAASTPRRAKALADFAVRSGLVPPERAPEVERAAGSDPLSDWAEREAADAAERWGEFARRLRDGDEHDRVRVEVAWAAGTLSNDLAVDYWGCDAEALRGLDVDRTCESNLVLEPDDPDGAHVRFLLAPHVNAMIVSLRAHWPEVTVMDQVGLRRLVEFRDRCASEPGLRVAYHVDY